ncbi:hypothetical protein FPRO05_10750 [Fusarium proliferatum]|uniref:Uncharacterized protein n=1 Tax=Gibberella intermedia TaxID=948311 RepID=A0A365NCB3_GIBIN|nr:hypothetical protein FPRO05_10750 [Fusarium proliferatum]
MLRPSPTMSDNCAPNEHTARDRASGSGRGNIGPDRNRHTNDGTSTLTERHGVQKSQPSMPLVTSASQAARPDRIAEARRLQLEIESESSLGRPCRSRARKAQGSLESFILEIPKVVQVLCAECGSTCHTLKGCITTTGIRGCVLCNSQSHATDSCDEFLNLGMGQKVKLLVTDRAGMPPIVTDLGWWVWLHKFQTAPHTEGQPIPTTFPWTVEFSCEVYRGKTQKSIKEYQHEVDHSHKVSALPTDARLQTMKDIFTLFWDREGRAWPARLDSRPASTKDNASSQTSTNSGAPSMEETQRLGDIIIGQAGEIHDWKKNKSPAPSPTMPTVIPSHEYPEASQVDTNDPDARLQYFFDVARYFGSHNYQVFQVTKESCIQRFNYTLESAIWTRFFCHLGEEAPEIPWTLDHFPSRARSLSDIYREWRIANGLDVPCSMSPLPTGSEDGN